MADEEHEKQWSYEGFLGEPEHCMFCRWRHSDECDYQCIIPDPADELKRRHKDMLDGSPQWQEDEDEDEEWRR